MPFPEMEQRALDSHPMKRFGKHDELANLAAFLLSDAVAYINGECITIDGGQWLRGAGEFNDLLEVPASEWEKLEQSRKKS
jgi:NAD(P)-dependent dehydrogenase (short-subunit alcohol dehydrogenase family)